MKKATQVFLMAAALITLSWSGGTMAKIQFDKTPTSFWGCYYTPYGGSGRSYCDD